MEADRVSHLMNELMAASGSLANWLSRHVMRDK